MSTAGICVSHSQGTSPGIALGSLVDLARLQVGNPSAAICDACSTIDIGSACYCKSCSHKLPAFDTAKEDTGVLRDKEFSWHALGMPERASVMDFAAFSVVINLLVVITALIPAP